MRLEAKGIGKQYRKGSWLFRDVNLSVEEGERVGIFGPSGCGKSTLCRILAGYEPATEGEVRLGGAPLPRSGYRPVQLMFQHPEKAVNPRWRIGEILNEGWVPDQELLESFEIRPHWLKKRPAELSGGELQRICIVRALSPLTRFLIADEITTMLDAISQARIWHVLLDIAAQRKIGMIVVSHDRQLIRRLCTKEIDFAKYCTIMR